MCRRLKRNACALQRATPRPNTLGLPSSCVSNRDQPPDAERGAKETKRGFRAEKLHVRLHAACTVVLSISRTGFFQSFPPLYLDSVHPACSTIRLSTLLSARVSPPTLCCTASFMVLTIPSNVLSSAFDCSVFLGSRQLEGAPILSQFLLLCF